MLPLVAASLFVCAVTSLPPATGKTEAAHGLNNLVVGGVSGGCKYYCRHPVFNNQLNVSKIRAPEPMTWIAAPRKEVVSNYIVSCMWLSEMTSYAHMLSHDGAHIFLLKQFFRRRWLRLIMHVRVPILLHCGKVSIVDGNVLVSKLVWFFNGTLVAKEDGSNSISWYWPLDFLKL